MPPSRHDIELDEREMISLPLVTPMNLSQYQRFNTFQQISHDRHHSDPFTEGSPALGESPLPMYDPDHPVHHPTPRRPPAQVHPSPAFSHLTRTTQYSYTPQIPPIELEKPTSAPADTTTFPLAEPYEYLTPPQHFTPLAGTPLRPIPAAWPGIKTEHHRSHSWAAASLPPVAESHNSFSSPDMPYATPLQKPLTMRGGVDGYDSHAYTTYPYPGPQEWEVPRAIPSKRSPEGCPEKQSRKHVCPVCDKRFNRPSSLQTHMAVHTGAKPFICPRHDCGRRFSVSSNLRRHEKTHIVKGLLPSDTAFTTAGVHYQPYTQPIAPTPYITQQNVPLEWQSAPLSSGLGHYSITRSSTRHVQPTTPETSLVISLGDIDDDFEAASKAFPQPTHM